MGTRYTCFFLVKHHRKCIPNVPDRGSESGGTLMSQISWLFLYRTGSQWLGEIQSMVINVLYPSKLFIGFLFCLSDSIKLHTVKQIGSCDDWWWTNYSFILLTCCYWHHTKAMKWNQWKHASPFCVLIDAIVIRFWMRSDIFIPSVG